MPPPRPKKMTAQPVRARHFAGKPGAAEVEEPSSEEDSESEKEVKPKPKPFAKPRPAPLASTFPKSALKPNLAARQKSEAERKKLEEEFETESEEEEESQEGSGSGSGSGSESEDESSEEESSSEEEAPKKLLRPVFLKKHQRNLGAAPAKTAEQLVEEEERRKSEQARELVQEQIEQRTAAKLKGRRDWDDDFEAEDLEAIDDTDGLDAEAEYAAWKLRELKRIKRDRLAIEEAEAEHAERERRQNLTEAEREAEDRELIEKQKEEKGDRDQMQYLQKYFHKGAFFQDNLKELGVDRRNVMGATFEDQTNRELLPQYMQIRDMTKLGKKGRTRYKDMKSEDTGQWGDYVDDRRSRNKSEYGLDERFRSDSYRGGRDEDRAREGATGANAKPLGERKRFGEESSRDSKRPRFDNR